MTDNWEADLPVGRFFGYWSFTTHHSLFTINHCCSGSVSTQRKRRELTIRKLRDSGNCLAIPLAWNEDTGSYQSEYQGAPASAGIRFTSDATTTETGGRNIPLPSCSVAFPNGLWIGGGANGRQQSIGTAAPAIGEHARGDIVWNLTPTPGGHVGWVCTEAGTPGIWKPFGDIEL